MCTITVKSNKQRWWENDQGRGIFPVAPWCKNTIRCYSQEFLSSRSETSLPVSKWQLVLITHRFGCLSSRICSISFHPLIEQHRWLPVLLSSKRDALPSSWHSSSIIRVNNFHFWHIVFGQCNLYKNVLNGTIATVASIQFNSIADLGGRHRCTAAAKH